MIAERWQLLATQERRALLFGGGLAVLLLGWALIWHPLAQRRAELRQQVEQSRHELDFVQRGATEVGRLRAAGTRSRADRQGRSLLALADATARSGGLENALKRVEPASSGSVRVSFESANFDALLDWVEELTRGYGVEAVDFSADRADGVGLVNARITLQDAP